MKVLFDTSVLVAALVQAHPRHDRALPWLKRAKDRKLDMSVASHTLAETYAVLTTLPTSPKISPGIAFRLLHDNVVPPARIVSLSSSEYLKTIRDLSDLGLSGGVTYDALIYRSALKFDAERILTFNANDFRRVARGDKIQIIEP